jgi:hypothetical protein
MIDQFGDQRLAPIQRQQIPRPRFRELQGLATCFSVSELVGRQGRRENGKTVGIEMFGGRCHRGVAMKRWFFNPGSSAVIKGQANLA